MNKEQAIQEAQEDRQIIGGNRVMGGFALMQLPDESYKTVTFDYGIPRLDRLVSTGKMVEFWDFHKGQEDWKVGKWERWPETLSLEKIKMLLAAAGNYHGYEQQTPPRLTGTRAYYALLVSNIQQLLARYCARAENGFADTFQNWLQSPDIVVQHTPVAMQIWEMQS